MEANEIMIGSELIAKFMGVNPMKAFGYENWYDGYQLQKAGLPFAYGAMGNGTSELKFHTSWDWLMPVVEKVEEVSYRVTITTYSICIERVSKDGKAIIKFPVSRGNTYKIQAVYEAVIEFINWYNQNKKEV